jgi:DNA (cytosine-5)-methyltransferase 1
MTEQISMIELFSGIGAQERALRQFGLPYEVKHTCDCDADAVLSYAAMRWDLEKEMETFDFPSQEQMVAELQAKNLGYDFQKGKHKITMRTPITKLKQYYIADKLTKNLGDISKVERLPYADFVTYSYPCTDLSVAGKGEGMVNKCDKCGCTWAINFENPKTNNICPDCGNIDIKSTRSGLLGQVQRLLTVSYEEGTLPRYLLLENVKNLVGKKFKPQFDAWVNWLDLIGYNTYYKVLNGKCYGIPQNRERIFAISIRKDVDTKGYIFPEQTPLELRLKDVLEKNVDEKYYLPDDRIEKILNSTFMQEKKRIQTTDVCDTLLARDYKDPKRVPVEELEPIRLGGLYDDEEGRHQAGAIWDKDAISPTLDTMQGGNRQPFIVDEIKVVGNYMPSNHDASRVVDIDGIAPTVKENHGTVTAIAEPFIVASRGRNPENPSDRTVGAPTEQRLEPNFSGCSNTLTSVQKDNYVAEPIVYDDYNSRISADQDAINTLTCNCGASAERNGVKIIEPVIVEDFYQSREPRVYTEASPTIRSERVGLKAADGEFEELVERIKWRIRKLTAKECWRLMAFTDEDVDRAARYVAASSLYKQAGNSIITMCLIAIMSSLFIEDGHKAEVWTKYTLNYND